MTNLPIERELTPKAATAKKVDEFVVALAREPQVEMPLRHFFAPGVYVREITMPAKTLVVGKVHRHEHVSILSKGVLRIWNEARPEDVEVLTNPATVVAPPFTRRVLYTLTECVFSNILPNPTNTTDLDALEAEMIVPREEHNNAIREAEETRTLQAGSSDGPGDAGEGEAGG